MNAKKLTAITAAVAISATLAVCPVIASETSGETAETTSASAEEPEGRGMSAVLLLSSVVGAAAVSVLIFRVRDKEKYL